MNIPDLCNALLASPDDDLCRLALADAIEESGDPDTAGLLRLHAYLGSLKASETPRTSLALWASLPTSPAVQRGEWQRDYGMHPHAKLFTPLRLPRQPHGLNRSLATVIHRVVYKYSNAELRHRLVESELHGLRLRPGVPSQIRYPPIEWSAIGSIGKNWRCVPLCYAPGAILHDLLKCIIALYRKNRRMIAIQLNHALNLIDVFDVMGGRNIQQRVMEKRRRDKEAVWLALSEEERNIIKEKQWRKYYS